MLNEFVLFENNIVPFLIEYFWILLFILVMAIDKRFRIGAVLMLSWHFLINDDHYSEFIRISMVLAIYILIITYPIYHREWKYKDRYETKFKSKLKYKRSLNRMKTMDQSETNNEEVKDNT